MAMNRDDTKPTYATNLIYNVVGIHQMSFNTIEELLHLSLKQQIASKEGIRPSRRKESC